DVSVRDDQSLVLVSTAPDLARVMPERYDFVTVDSFEGGRLAGQTLREAGCRRVCFVGCSPETEPRSHFDLASRQRLAGLEAGLGWKLDDELKLDCGFYQTAPG